MTRYVLLDLLYKSWFLCYFLFYCFNWFAFFACHQAYFSRSKSIATYFIVLLLELVLLFLIFRIFLVLLLFFLLVSLFFPSFLLLLLPLLLLLVLHLLFYFFFFFLLRVSSFFLVLLLLHFSSSCSSCSSCSFPSFLFTVISCSIFFNRFASFVGCRAYFSRSNSLAILPRNLFHCC